MSMEQWKNVCRAEFEKVHSAIARSDAAIRGNGRFGLVSRMDRLALAAKRRIRLLRLLIGAVIPLAVAHATTVRTILCQ